MREVITRLRALKFGQSGYIGLLDRSGHSVLSPSDANLEGQHYQNMPTAQSTPLAQVMATALAGGGFLHYSWPDQASGTTVNKTALVRQVEQWGWILVASIQDDELQDAVRQELRQQASSTSERWRDLLWPLLLALTLGVAASYGFPRWSRRLFERYHADMMAKNLAVADSEALFRAVFDNAAVGMAQAAPNGKYLQINQKFSELLGYFREEVRSAGLDFQSITLP